MQTKLVDDNNSIIDTISIFFRSIRGDEKLKKKTITKIGNKVTILDLISKISKKTGGKHKLRQLRLSTNLRKWITELMNDPVNAEYSIIENIINDFSDNMMTRARETGKYVVAIILSDRFIVCHSDSGQKTISTDFKVIERLLDVDNVDKYAEFLLEGNEVVVNHFDRYKSKSFTSWLGIPEKEIIFDIRGKIKIHTEIDGLTSCFEFTEEELVRKILNKNNQYDLKDQYLITPNNSYLVTHISWGREKYEDIDEFKQKLLTIFLQLDYYRNKYVEINQRLTKFFNSKIIDEEDRVKSYPDSNVLVIKNHDKLQLLFVNNYISLDIKWGKKIARQFIENSQLLPFYHCGMQLIEEPQQFGNFQIYNWISHQEHIDLLSKLCDIIYQAATMTYKNLLSLIIFTILKDISKRKPIEHFFSKLSDIFLEQLRFNINGKNTIILADETDTLIEFKSADWFTSEPNDKELSKKIAKELKHSSIIIGGIDEQEQRIYPLLRSRFKSERIENIQKLLKGNCGLPKTKIQSVPLSNGECLLLITHL